MPIEGASLGAPSVPRPGRYEVPRYELGVLPKDVLVNKETGRNRGSLRGGACRSGAVWVNPAADRQASIEAITVE
jgi:hypothetical protein